MEEARSVLGERKSSGTKCGRWNPTGEQVKVLTELFRAGLRTPTTDQIQNISTQLSSYGKIESKNVFYWFQNHKARERHKRRRVDALKPTLPTPKCLEERKNDEVEEEREIETLELFPMMKESEKLSLWMLSRECKENNSTNNHDYHHATFSYTNNLGREIDRRLHPPLDLRLSFF